MALQIPESRLVELWQTPVQRRADLKTTAGYPVSIIYPGRPNDARGADIKDAVIMTPQGLIKGDIEFHVKSSGWRQHGHTKDPAYNSVILHIVKDNDTEEAITLQNGIEVTTLSLNGYTEEQADGRLSSIFSPALLPPCQKKPEIIPALLDEAGQARLLQKTAAYAESLIKEKASQVLYQGIMTALGYSKNKIPMTKLAKAVKLEELEAIIAVCADDGECRLQIEARLLGTSGLLPSQRLTIFPPHEFISQLEQRWQDSNRTAQMSLNEWEFFKVRPGNYPVRRIAAMAALLTKHRKSGIFQVLKNVLETGKENAANAMEKALLLQEDGFWKNHSDFIRPAGGLGKSLLGRERAAEIIINVVLPFFIAYAQQMAKPELEQSALDIYHDFPAPVENSLEKHMKKQLGISSNLIGTSQKRQGLIHIYKTLCTQGKCDSCPLH